MKLEGKRREKVIVSLLMFLLSASIFKMDMPSLDMNDEIKAANLHPHSKVLSSGLFFLRKTDKCF